MWRNSDQFPVWIFIGVYLLSIVGWVTLMVDLHGKPTRKPRDHDVLFILLFCTIPMVSLIVPIAFGSVLIAYFVGRFTWKHWRTFKRSGKRPGPALANPEIRLSAKRPTAIARFIPKKLLDLL
jgi:hypothetical protein